MLRSRFSPISSYSLGSRNTLRSLRNNAGIPLLRFSTSSDSEKSGPASNVSPELSQDQNQSWIMRKFGPDTVRESRPINRWSMVLPAIGTHICIGSPWGWSVFSGPISRELGFVSSAAADWSFSEVTIPLSIVFALQGIAAAIGGKWQMKVGPRISMGIAGLCFGGGLVLGGLGIKYHSLGLLYAGYGLLGGSGVGLGYTPPLAALLEWFPDKKGLASGICIGAFGSGALLFAPMSNFFMEKFAKMPQYLGTTDQVNILNQDGKLFSEVGGALKEVVIAGKTELAKLPYDLAEGVYVVGTGSTGAYEALSICGLLYLASMLSSAWAIRRPPVGYTVSVPESDKNSVEKSQIVESVVKAPIGNVNVDNAMRLPQFYLLATTFFCMSSGGIGLFAVAKPMMNEVFSGTLPSLVTASFASTYLLLLSAANLGGRLGWAAVSDYIGRRKTFFIFTLGSIPLYLSIPYLVNEVVTTQNPDPLYLFVGSTVAAISCMGGTYALLPAYEADLMGSKYIGAIHGRMLLASTAGALGGPSLLLYLRGLSERSAIDNLVSKIDPLLFERTFGASSSSLETLIKAKTVTISKLMEIVPAGVPDPTPFIYDSTMYTMSGLMFIAALSHALVRPVNSKYFEKSSDTI